MAMDMVAAKVEKLSCMLKDPSPHIPFSRAAAFESVQSILGRISQSFSTDDLQGPFYMRSVCAFVAEAVQRCFQPPAATLPVPPILAVAVSTTLQVPVVLTSWCLVVVELIRIVVVTHNTEADPASSHLEVVDITPKTEADQASSHLEVVDITANTEADPASSHLEVVNITRIREADSASFHLNVVDNTPNTEAEPISSLLEVVDVIPEERTLTIAVFATLPADIQAGCCCGHLGCHPTRHVTKDVTLDVPCRAWKGVVQRFFLQALEGSVLLRLPQGRGGTILIIHQTFRNGIEP
eukprot:XP_014010953.1 PREDICTED: uncharacterized protein LOC106577468 [Salmo salar]